MYNATISACAKAGQPEAKALLAESLGFIGKVEEEDHYKCILRMGVLVVSIQASGKTRENMEWNGNILHRNIMSKFSRG